MATQNHVMRVELIYTQSIIHNISEISYISLLGFSHGFKLLVTETKYQGLS